MTGTRCLLTFCLAALLATGVASAAPPGKSKKSADEGPGVSGSLGIVFTDTERAIITSYFAPRGGAPAASGKPLPPGIAKKVARGGSLPPGIAKRYLPSDLNERLPPPPVGLERLIVGNDVLLVQISTGAILDVIRQALR